eukprot:SAG31_NODE_20856_length_564_cov_0.772043_2_plen_20_part_01
MLIIPPSLFVVATLVADPGG